ncbi:cold shock domain-containing protein [Lysobacter sp. MMG2]|uniref:cold shock domain-containing protein n=1 Tax=Lysobacter sp. MMG2 TaxID=2801338 RepID=UPI001C219715|nr:cold shock domain-containing protein [Lysobacter sp. MMG2]MBU8975897.1 cold shock domain-containing protein [Lysobacter sp. MMG2]
MRAHGTLAEWNDDRGFGFIAAAQGGEKVFVHVSAFPRDGQRPRLGELISFEIERDANGKPRATSVMRPGAQSTTRPRRHSERPARPARFVSAILSVLAIAAIGAYAYTQLDGAAQPQAVAPATVAVQPAAAAAQPAASPAFTCDGRTMCSQMNSCAEAKYFLQHCPHTAMDGNGDGVPCEQQWCD